MRLAVYAILFQICGNNIVFIENGKPSAVCHTVSLTCNLLNVYQLVVIRNTSQCSKLQQFQAIE